MKLLQLQIEKLYGNYNYNVLFNPDITFIYGLNGCGKTTVLNITEAIITGQIYKLFGYKFYKIILKYANQDNLDNVMEICIEKKDGYIIVKFNGQPHKIDQFDIVNETKHLEFEDFKKLKYYFNEYKVLVDIRETFNYVYLPLNRSSVIYDFDYIDKLHYYPETRKYGFVNSFGEPRNKDFAMWEIEGLIKDKCRKIDHKISNLNDKFRNNILKSSLDINENYTDPNKWITEIISQKTNIDNIKETKAAYIEMLKDLSLINKDEERHFIEFFDGLYNDVNERSEGITAATMLKLNEVVKIKKIVSIAEKLERQKANIRKPLERFVETMNDFINTSDDKKEIKINSEGHIYFTTKHSNDKISIQYLSSGEKQLITFFANLIFKVGSSKSGIFVVDEPELSLHLFWQKIFVEKTLEINKNIQLIFATHAPEIIGKNRNKMFRLEKEYVD